MRGDLNSRADLKRSKHQPFIFCWRMLMFLTGQLLGTNCGRSVKSNKRTRAYIFPALLGLLLFLCLAPGALAQGLSNSTLRGVVKDPSGGLVANASVKLISTTTNA